jgi:hypothetical protein
MIKKTLLSVALVAGLFVAGSTTADAGVYVRRVAPVRRAALPPYPVARRVVAGPVYRPVVTRGVYAAGIYSAPVYAAPVYRPMVYSPGVAVSIGW